VSEPNTRSLALAIRRGLGEGSAAWSGGSFAAASPARSSASCCPGAGTVGSVTGDRDLYWVSLLSGADGAVLGGVGGAWPYWVSHFAFASAALNDPTYSEFASAPL
jgi:hypothetical protein